MIKKFIKIITILALTNNINNFVFANNIKIKFENKLTIMLELADTEKKRRIGLMSRERLGKYSGMFFDYKELSKVKIWMKDTLIPLDIIFLNKNKIVYIKRNALPCLEPDSNCPTFSAEELVDSVIEVNAGIVDEYNLKIGDIIFY